MRQINDRGLAILKAYEGCKLKAYLDAVGVWTIGYGHTGNVREGQRISMGDAEALLNDDLRKFERGVTEVVSANLNDNEFSALVSFAFNVGLGALLDSTLRRLLNTTSDRTKVADEFLRWNKGTVNGQKVELPGLTKRRQSERALFLGQTDPFGITAQASLNESVNDEGVGIGTLSPKALRELQELLNKAGYDCGAVDGLYGPKTADAWADFKESQYLGKPHLIGRGSYDVLINEAATRAQSSVPFTNEQPLIVRSGSAIALPTGQTVYTNQPIIPNGNFTWGEATHGGSRIPESVQIVRNIEALAKELQRVRNHIGKPMHITSWYRPPAVNRAVGGAKYSQHLHGNAADIAVDGMSGYQLAAVCRWWNGGVGIYSHAKSFAHFDTGAYRRWGGAPFK